jgi:tyrosyl-tRNA synthetase
LAADLGEETVRTLQDQVAAGGPEAGRAKRRVARAVVALYHGDAAAGDAEAAFDRQFRDHEAPEAIEEVTIPPDAVDGERVYIPRVLAELGLASSRSDARRLISQGGVKINGETVSTEEVARDGLMGAVLQVGKRRFVRVIG